VHPTHAPPSEPSVADAVQHVAELQAALDQLTRADAEHRALMASMDQVILVLDSQGRYLRIPTTRASRWHRRAEDLLGRTVYDVLPPELAALAAAGIRQALSTGAPMRFEHDAAFAGAVLRFDVCITPLPDGTVVWQATDVTARHAAEENLRMAKEDAEASNRSKSEFLARMSHELRTPLNSVIGFSRQLRRDKRGVLADSEFAFIDRIERNGRHLLNIINDILDLAKVEAGKLQLRVTEEDVRTLAADVVAMFEMAGIERGVPVLLIAPSTTVIARLDADRLRQVLINLVGNAVKFTARGQVRLEVAYTEDRRPQIRVIDTGIGIPAHRLEAVFEAFEQADGTKSRHYEGTGLGLAIARALTEEMGGSLTAASEEGAGSEFTLTLTAGAVLDAVMVEQEPPSAW
jgi:signal transduction histidine kinase